MDILILFEIVQRGNRCLIDILHFFLCVFFFFIWLITLLLQLIFVVVKNIFFCQFVVRPFLLFSLCVFNFGNLNDCDIVLICKATVPPSSFQYYVIIFKQKCIHVNMHVVWGFSVMTLCWVYFMEIMCPLNISE